MYQRNQYSGFGLGLTPAVKTLVIVNVSIFIIINLFRKIAWISLFGMVPAVVFSRFWIWQIFTYMFLHLGLWHLILNMLMLWFFGPTIEAAWGRKQFLIYYFFTGIGAALCSFFVSIGSYIPVIGASGAIFGILVAYAVMFPESIILLFLIFPMKMKHAILVLGAINLLGAISSPGSGIAYFAHLGGGIFGYLYLKNEWLKMKFLRFSFSIDGLKNKYSQHNIRGKEIEKKNLNEQVDQILDKVSQEGIGSLSPKERAILERKSRQK